MNYWQEGNVEDIEWEDDCIRAVVLGTEYYEVKIYLSNDRVDEMYCTCLYAEDGNACKHMAAVLYVVEEGTCSSEEKSSADISQWQSIIENMSEEKLRSMLTAIVSADKHLQEIVILRSQDSVERILLHLRCMGCALSRLFMRRSGSSIRR